MTIEEALAQHPGHWNRGRKVAYLNDGGDLILIGRTEDGENTDTCRTPGTNHVARMVPMIPASLRRVAGSDAMKVAAFHEFIGTRQRFAA